MGSTWGGGGGGRGNNLYLLIYWGACAPCPPVATTTLRMHLTVSNSTSINLWVVSIHRGGGGGEDAVLFNEWTIHPPPPPPPMNKNSCIFTPVSTSNHHGYKRHCKYICAPVWTPSVSTVSVSNLAQGTTTLQQTVFIVHIYAHSHVDENSVSQKQQGGKTDIQSFNGTLSDDEYKIFQTG